jgi:hypothetical protein
MRPKKPETTRSGDLFRARLDQIINLKHELAQLAGQIRLGLYRRRDRPALQRQGSRNWRLWNDRCWRIVLKKSFFADD